MSREVPRVRPAFFKFVCRGVKLTTPMSPDGKRIIAYSYLKKSDDTKSRRGRHQVILRKSSLSQVDIMD